MKTLLKIVFALLFLGFAGLMVVSLTNMDSNNVAHKIGDPIDRATR